jgi:hypothetical protein
MPTAIETIRREAEPVLTRLALVSHAPTTNLGSVRVANGSHDSSRPSGDAIPDAEYFRDRLERAETVSDAREALREARACLTGILRRTMAHVPGETAGELAARMIEDGEGWEPRAVADAMHCTPTFVRRSRVSLGRDPETGYSAPDGDPMAVAMELHAAGRSLRTIARLTGVPRSTLHARLT